MGAYSCRLHPAGVSRWGIAELVGNGWELTDTAFAPFPGFTPYMTRYPDYSKDFFDGKHFVVKGASWRLRSSYAANVSQLVSKSLSVLIRSFAACQARANDLHLSHLLKPYGKRLFWCSPIKPSVLRVIITFPNSIHKEYFDRSETHSTCPWKGTASYYHLRVGNRPIPMPPGTILSRRTLPNRSKGTSPSGAGESYRLNTCGR